MTPAAGLRFGNWLYLWLDAHARTSAGFPTLVLESPAMAEWLDAFPALRALTIARGDLRFHDRREWDDASWGQRFGVDFAVDELESFIRDALVWRVIPDTSNTLVVNVRRGDYYERPELRERYGFDQVGYVAAAIACFTDVESVLVVSDDPQWCRDNLDPVLRARAREVDYAAPGGLANFVTIAGARRIIGTNSTFSYWAAYVADVVHPDAQIVMPRFHGRLPQGKNAYQLDPRWQTLKGFD